MRDQAYIVQGFKSVLHSLSISSVHLVLFKMFTLFLKNLLGKKNHSIDLVSSVLQIRPVDCQKDGLSLSFEQALK